MNKKLSWLFVFCLVLLISVGCQKPPDTVVNIKSGPISGKVEDGVRVYLGIPFAAPPVGARRWKPPYPPRPWKNVKACTKFGPACPQPKLHDVGRENEDCLYLNVWTPAKNADAKLPVMFFIHGGGFLAGAASQKLYDAENLAKKGVVVVTINYRLGPYGFMAHPLLAKESPHGVSGNYGFLDQVAALKWVQKNIAVFGGNPDNVTIFGESAGSVSVATHMISPLSKGLFQQAICESGSAFGQQYALPKATGSMSEALATGKQVEKLLDCADAPNVLKAMRKVSAVELLKKIDPGFGLFDERPQFSLINDGWVIPENPAAFLAKGKQHDVPIIIGSNADEGNVFIPETSVGKYKSWIKNYFGKYADQIYTLFPAAKDAEVRPAFNKLLAVCLFAEPGRYLARAMGKKKSKAYLYQFTRVPNTKSAKQDGAYHGIELGYVFGNLEKSEGYDEKDFALSDMIMDYWVTFAKTGNPNGEGRTNWPAYYSASDQYLELGDTVIVKKHLLKQASDLLDRIVGK
ncbi:MAG: carboxylesterase family protein [Candidatus Margulisbacteria bacterium]|nr:carboxylesterase family protein [Candidatus Margulisiibacteriota bacterium]MBU1022277.1 carboxylesterase family protein [Candidatus Margulisiibacteriota bacterium]MBU1729284.1 carboxylesterase family protein [Candidatus Margulisiibacteriota bacterium]MBU1955557.1 carboxylesterase family protein [Candidatus Margulisiibacteriota bacterium]